MLAFAVTFARNASAAGSFKLKTTTVDEVVGSGWHLFMTIELPAVPPIAHQSMKFVFTKTATYKRMLVDGHDAPVITREVLSGQSPVVESFDVDFSDLTGKVFKITRFDFSLTRPSGFDAGEYRVDVRTADGVVIGGPQYLSLKGDNEVEDFRTMQFSAKDKSVKKVNGHDAGASAGGNHSLPGSAGGNGEVTPTGNAQPFIPKEGFQRTTEEEIKTRPSGCGCSVPGRNEGLGNRSGVWLTSFAGLGIAFFRVRRARRVHRRSA